MFGKHSFPLHIAKWICFGIVLAFFFGWIVMLLWNWLMPTIFGLSVITYWQAWGLVILSHLLFKAGHGHHSKHDHICGPANWKDTFRSKMKAHFNHETDDSEPETTES